ncbi:MAG: sulfatase [Acidimicrobiaceae bacterium]|nr:sulfatase [Acidimicrobiaceae bacterium]
MKRVHSLNREPTPSISRRAILRAAGCGFGYLGLAGLLAQESSFLAGSSETPLAPRLPLWKPPAKRVIFLFMHGGPSSIDILDPKERLVRDHGKPLPIKRPLAFDEALPGPLMKSPWQFRPGGQSGVPISDLFPQVRRCADDLCVIRSMVGEGVDHGAALLQTFTGTSTFIRPSMGAWVLYGLGTENQNLPGFITIKPALSHGGAKNWSSAFLPGFFQGTAVGHAGLKVGKIKGDPIAYLQNQRFSPEQQRYELDMLQNMNRRHQALRQHDPDLESRIQAFELAFRMQSQAPEAFEVDRESEATKKLYGLNDPVTSDFAWQCLLARRLAERGVRYIQCTHSYKWDQHGELLAKHTQNAREVDKPIAGLLKDLKTRGLLKDTLVIWAGEFGRTPVSQGGDGRDHNPYGYSIWMAGGGVKPGFIYGATDEIGYHAVEDRMHIHDFHATVLHLLGLDHQQLTYHHSGRDFRLTDVAGTVAHKIIA